MRSSETMFRKALHIPFPPPGTLCDISLLLLFSSLPFQFFEKSILPFLQIVKQFLYVMRGQSTYICLSHKLTDGKDSSGRDR